MLQKAIAFGYFIAKFLQYLLCIMPVILLAILAEFFSFDYGFFGVTIIFLFYVFKNSKTLMILSYSLTCTIYYVLQIIINGYSYWYVLLCLFTILPIFLICLYNGKQGKKVKWILYLFYPVHLIILYLLTFVLQN